MCLRFAAEREPLLHEEDLPPVFSSQKHRLFSPEAERSSGVTGSPSAQSDSLAARLSLDSG